MDGDYSSPTVGVCMDAQAKFLPACKFSPLVGLRVEFNLLRDEDCDNMQSRDKSFYMGGAINF